MHSVVHAPEYNKLIDTRSLYIHWPFCAYKCHFCDFVALASHDQFMERYHYALCTEIESFGHDWGNRYIDTIFMGGGTPSTYPDALLLDMFGRLRKIVEFNEMTEVTIEVNPGTVRPEQLDVWQSVGINRLSIGVQSLKDSVLKSLNRLQQAEQVITLLSWASKKFANISVDLIIGLPGVSSQEWQDLIQQVVTWPVTHVSVYFLTVHENTPLFYSVKKKQVNLPIDDEVVDLYTWTIETLKHYGFEQYEISNFARPSYASRHNKAYWERRPYKGFGLGACSFDGKSRFQNQKNLGKYLEGVEQGLSVIVSAESLTPEQEQLESIMLGLRCTNGMNRATLYSSLLPIQQEGFNSKVQEFKMRKLMMEGDGRLFLTPAGLAVENEIVTKLLC